MNHEINTPQLSYDDYQTEVKRSTQPLVEQQEAPGIGAEGRRELGRRILQATNIIASNPERVIVDTQNPSNSEQTIHDPEKAQLVAEVIKEDMDYIAKHKQKSRIFRAMTKGKRERAELNRRYWGQIAENAYDANPLQAGSSSIRELRRSNKNAAFRSR